MPTSALWRRTRTASLARSPRGWRLRRRPAQGRGPARPAHTALPGRAAPRRRRRAAPAARAGDGDVVAARVHHDAEPALDLRQVLSVWPDQRRGGTVVVEV